VQSGWGRTGGKWFGIEQYGVKPDIMVAAKSLGNGHPVGATVARSGVADSFKGLTLATFGRQPRDHGGGQGRGGRDRPGPPTAAVMEAAKDRGLIIGKGGLFGNVLRTSPALNVTTDDADRAADVLDQAFADVGHR